MRLLLSLHLLVLSVGASADTIARDADLMWFSGGRPTPAALSLVRELQTADARGLRPADYDAAGLAGALRNLPASAGDSRIRALDEALTRAAGRMAKDVHAGRIDPRRLGHDLELAKGRVAPETLAATLARAPDVGAALDALEPAMKQYGLLKAALRRYRLLDENLTRLPPLPKRSLNVGDPYAGAAALRRLLRAGGDLAETDPSVEDVPPEVFDITLSQGLRLFQSRHGLEADGVLGAATFRELTTPFSRRITQVELSLERMRWLPAFDSPPIIVNIPQFRLFALRKNTDLPEDILQMDVVVGAAFEPHRTPVFAAQMQYIVLRPYWDVPRSILLAELLPAIRRNPAYLQANDYEIVRGQGDDAVPQEPTAQAIDALARGELRLRQRPGPLNALGRVKFMMPNRHNVYLHDTPARSLFSRSRRDFSHGCIRVSDPIALVRHVLGEGTPWTVERIMVLMEQDRPTRISLPRPIPVFVLYATALVRSTGETLFFHDLYGHDARLEAALAAR